MTALRSDLLHALQERGFIHQCTDLEKLDAELAKNSLSAYVGFDCTAPSLHAGSLIQLMVMRWMQKTGHRPIALLGGATTRVGDPSGKDESRRMLTDEEIDRNLESISKNLEQFLTFGNNPGDAILVNNDEWLSGMNYIDFLRTVGSRFSVNRMLTQDSVRLRLEREQNLSFLEFNYMVLQAYDFVELHRRYGCTLQTGGSDQWGNIIMGIELDRRMTSGEQFRPLDVPQQKASGMKVLEVQPMIKSSGHDLATYNPTHFMEQLREEQSGKLFGLTTPLLTTSSGAKMGKTAAGAVWLNKDFLTAYEYWQYWRNTEDADVGRFLRLFTELPIAEIVKLEALKDAEINEAKKVLANEATKICHGDRAARKAAETARQTFEEGAFGDDLPEVELTREQIGKGIPAYELFRLAYLVSSGGEAKRLIRGGGARMNDRKVMDEQEMIGQERFRGGPLKLSAGRKRHARVTLIS